MTNSRNEISNAGGVVIDIEQTVEALRRVALEQRQQIETERVEAAFWKEESRKQSNEADRLRAEFEAQGNRADIEARSTAKAVSALQHARDPMCLALFLLVDSEQSAKCSKCHEDLSPTATANFHELQVVNPIDRRIVKFNQEAHTDECQTAFAVTSLHDALSRIPL